MDCPKCPITCCNENFHELVHGYVGLKYCVVLVKSGRGDDAIMERMDDSMARVAKAMKCCNRANEDT